MSRLSLASLDRRVDALVKTTADRIQSSEAYMDRRVKGLAEKVEALEQLHVKRLKAKADNLEARVARLEARAQRPWWQCVLPFLFL